jgi:HlyD family secretion protein
MKRKTIVLWTVLLASGGGIAWKAMQGPAPTTVYTVKVEKVEHLRSLVTATGEIRAKEFVNIQAEVPGVIVDLRVREGDEVKQGDILLCLDDLQLKADQDAAQAQVGAAQAEAQNCEVGVATAIANLTGEETALANLKVERSQAQITRDRSNASLQRKKELLDGGLLGLEEYEVAEADARISQQRLDWNDARIKQGEANLRAMATRVDAAKAQKDGACRRIEAAQAALARATNLVGKTVLRSPLKGRITKLNVEKGECAVPGIQSNPIATLMTIADMSVIEAEIKVGEADIVAVQLGAPAKVEVDAQREAKMAGVVTEIGQSPILAQNGGTQSQEGKDFKVVVRLQDPPAMLRTGLTATAEIETAVRDNVLVVPLQALTAREVEVDAQDRYVPPPEPIPGEVLLASPRHGNRKELKGVFLLQDGRARFRPVQTGITGDMDIELLAGLQSGDVVINGPYQVLRSIKEWDPVKVDEKKQAEDQFRLQRKRK